MLLAMEHHFVNIDLMIDLFSIPEQIKNRDYLLKSVVLYSTTENTASIVPYRVHALIVIEGAVIVRQDLPRFWRHEPVRGVLTSPC